MLAKRFQPPPKKRTSQQMQGTSRASSFPPLIVARLRRYLTISLLRSLFALELLMRLDSRLSAPGEALLILISCIAGHARPRRFRCAQRVGARLVVGEPAQAARAHAAAAAAYENEPLRHAWRPITPAASRSPLQPPPSPYLPPVPMSVPLGSRAPPPAIRQARRLRQRP